MSQAVEVVSYEVVAAGPHRIMQTTRMAGAYVVRKPLLVAPIALGMVLGLGNMLPRASAAPDKGSASTPAKTR
jgi:hypothetical protein